MPPSPHSPQGIRDKQQDAAQKKPGVRIEFWNCWRQLASTATGLTLDRVYGIGSEDSANETEG
jgi:hypothetical protein